MMISVIIIGRNEGKTIGVCYNSVIKAFRVNKISNFEIIYIDSNSDDDTLKIVSTYSRYNIKIYKIYKNYNPPNARNLGAIKAKGDILLFLDADMELNSEFLNHAYSNGELISPLISGRMLHKFYDTRWIYRKELLMPNKEKPFYKPLNGGAILIEKQLWNRFDGMDGRFKRAADPEMGLRMAKGGFLALSLPHTFIVHHTAEKHKNWKWSTLRNRYNWYGSALYYRKNLFNSFMYRDLFTRDKSLLVLLFSLVLIFSFDCLCYLLLYLIAVFIRSLYSRSFYDFFYFVFRDISSLIALIIFFPAFKEVEYTSISLNQKD